MHCRYVDIGYYTCLWSLSYPFNFPLSTANIQYNFVFATRYTASDTIQRTKALTHDSFSLYSFVTHLCDKNVCNKKKHLQCYILCIGTYTNYVFRLTPLTTPPVEKSTMMNLSLQEIILIGNASEQVGNKFNIQ